MGQVLVAAWVGVMVGWIGFGWALDEAPGERVARMAAAGTGSMQVAVTVGEALRG